MVETRYRLARDHDEGPQHGETAQRDEWGGKLKPELQRANDKPPVYRYFERSWVGRRTGSIPGIAWFGFRSFWGHLRHLVASFIATDDIDARDWMQPDTPEELVQRIAQHLEAKNQGSNLLSRLDRDFFVDYIADGGDSADVSLAVGRILFREYTLADSSGELTHVPRGDILLFGGDTAYPVATSQEIHDRVVVPFNQVLASLEDDERPRVLLGIPGNHDWYDGLDGFARLFRQRPLESVKPSEPTQPLGESQIDKTVDLVTKFVTGGRVEKQSILAIKGYTPVQNASYFALPITHNCDLFAVDRQLKNIDFRQRNYFRKHHSRTQAAKRWLVLPTPPYAYGRGQAHGLETFSDLKIELESKDNFILAGDVHHYRRENIGDAIQVTAGGGGAFLHPAAFEGEVPDTNIAEAQWPNLAQTKSLLRHVPWHVGAGRAGTIVHAVIAICFAPILTAANFGFGHEGLVPGAIAGGLLSAVACAFIGGIRRGRFWPIASLALLTGILIGLLPAFSIWAVGASLSFFGFHAPAWLCGIIALATAVFSGGILFGGYLSLLTWLGLEYTQAFTALGHPGFRHFVRFRVRADGSAVDAWCIGLADPLAKDEEPVLVDQFTWPLTPSDPLA